MPVERHIGYPKQERMFYASPATFQLQRPYVGTVEPKPINLHVYLNRWFPKHLSHSYPTPCHAL